MPAKPKTYVPGSSARIHTFPDGNKIIKLSFKGVALRAFLDQHVNDKGYLNLIVAERREMGQFGDTHSVSLDEWKPKQDGGTRTPPRQAAPTQSDPSDDSSDPVPF